MISLSETETIRRAYYLEGKSIREIAREYHHGRRAVRNAIGDASPPEYIQQQERAAPVLGEYKERIQELVDESKEQPRKQRYTARKIYEMIRAEGYLGSESTVRRYVGQIRKKKKEVYLPLQFDEGDYSQVDWGEAQVEIGGVRQTGHIFVIRLNYSKVRFVVAYPFEKQEAFLDGHVRAFQFFGGIPRHVTYDNLATAVYRVLAGKNRHEQDTFIQFRSHYLYESRYCNVGQAHEKGGVESDVGYVRRSFLTPVPKVESWDALNKHLEHACQQALQRKMWGETASIGEQFEKERAYLLPLPRRPYPACVARPAKTNPYSQVVYETNRYSVPAEYAGKQLVIRAYPFHIEIVSMNEIIAVHQRCFEREKDIYDPMHYLSLLMQRPGAFEHAAPIRQWRKNWPPAYEKLLAMLQERLPENQVVREFLSILELNRQYPAGQVERAIRQVLSFGVPSLDAVQLRLRDLTTPPPALSQADLSEYPTLANMGEYTVNVGQYDALVGHTLEVRHG